MMENESSPAFLCTPCLANKATESQGVRVLKLSQGGLCLLWGAACLSVVTGTTALMLLSYQDSRLVQDPIVDTHLESRTAAGMAVNAKTVGNARRLDSSETADCDSMYDVAQNLKANNSYMLTLVYSLGFLSCFFVVVFGSIYLGRRLKPVPPWYWTIRQSFGVRKFFNDAYRYEVDVTEEFKDKMQKIIDSTTDPGRMGKGRDGAWVKHRGFEVVKVTRIEDGKLWTRYQQCKSHIPPIDKSLSEHMHDDLVSDAEAAIQLVTNATTRAKMCLGDFLQLDTDRCETMLFHGSPSAGARNPETGKVMYEEEGQSPVGVIKQQGFDDRVGSVSGMLGSGTYFADKASKADCYSGRYNSFGDDYTSIGEEATMFLSRVVMGTPFLTKQSLEQLRRPPCMKGHFDLNLTFRDVTIGKPWTQKAGVIFKICEHARFDSVISDLEIDGAKKLYREFTVYEKQTYPEFCITYKRVGTMPTNVVKSPSASHSSSSFSHILGVSQDLV